MFISRSLVFYPGFFEDNCQELSDQIIVPSYYLNRLIDDFEEGEKLYLNILLLILIKIFLSQLVHLTHSTGTLSLRHNGFSTLLIVLGAVNL